MERPSALSMAPSCSWTSAACEGGVSSAWRTKVAAAITKTTAEVRNPERMHPPGGESGETTPRLYKNRACAGRRPLKGRPTSGMMHPPGGFRKAKSISAGVLLDRHAVVHLVDTQDLRVAAVTTQFVVLAHDQGL